jgi:ParB family chromosome partitioning protein
MNLESGVLQVHVEDIIPNRFQPRLNFDEQALQELAASIRENGIIQPLVLRKLGDKYEIIAGERRFKAAQIAGLTTVPAVISNIDDNKSAEVALVENVQRKDLTAIEEARSYKNLLDKGYLTQEQLAKKMGLSQPAVANKLRLLNLDDEVQQALLDEKISERHARTLLRLSSKEQQRDWLHKIINERLTVRQLDLEINKTLNPNTNTSEGPAIIDGPRTVAEIMANAQDLNKKKEKPDFMAPQEVVDAPLETLSIDNSEDIIRTPEEESTNAVAQTGEIPNRIPVTENIQGLNIVTPESSENIIKDDQITENEGRFFNYGEPNNSVSDSGVEVFSSPTFGEPEEVVPEFEEKPDIMKPMNETFTNEQQTFNFNPNNKFFNQNDEAINIDSAPKEIKREVPNPMEAVNYLDYEQHEEQIKSLELKDAIDIFRKDVEMLNSSGITAKIEEIDFDDNYQITIQIDKDNN